MGEGFDHRFGLQYSRRQALQQQQAHAGVLLDRPAHGGGWCGHHLDPGEGHSVIEAIGALAGKQREHTKQAVLTQQGHGDLLAGFIYPRQPDRSAPQQIDPLGWIAGKKNRLAPFDRLDTAAGQAPDHFQQGGVALAGAAHACHHARGTRRWGVGGTAKSVGSANHQGLGKCRDPKDHPGGGL